MKARTQASLFLLVLLHTACSGGDKSSVENNTTSTIVDDEGGRLSFAGVTITVPPDAVDEPTQITISVTGAPPTALPAERRFSGPVYMLTPHGQRFAKSVTVTFPREEGSNELWSLQDPQDDLWELEAHVELESDHARLSTTHFSYFAWLLLTEDAEVAQDAGVEQDAGPDAAL